MHGMKRNPRIVGILQARTGSTRLPAKVLATICGKPMISIILDRLSDSRTLDTLVLATTLLEADEELARLAEVLRLPYFRGSENNVLDRYYRAADFFRADLIVRLTGDNPFVDGTFVDEAVHCFLDSQPQVDYVTSEEGGFPLGLSAEVFSFRSLERAWREDENPAWREHVTPFIYSHPELFSIKRMTAEEDLAYMRWTVDTLEDLEFVRSVFNHFGNSRFSYRDAMQLLKEKPEMLEINRHVEQKTLSK